ncbi:MAG: cysteine desulfurase [Candidatus Marinimicrobia bacterium]|nr:cysteine desulfurase [Candidatus Neomarinimicrobiota bacterium]
MTLKTNKRIYLDHSATTPVDPEVIKAMNSAMENSWGNPSSIHSDGRNARFLIEEARERVADLMNALPNEIHFTSGGTEADNWALRGIAHSLKEKGNHIITAETEHPAVIDSCKELEKEGFDVSYLFTDNRGSVHRHDLEAEIRPETVLISIMHSNNEVGTINLVHKYVEAAHEAGVLFHSDMVQSYGKVPVDVKQLDVDLASVSSHKIYGPKGVGALYIHSGIEIKQLLFGGHQERNRRGGTENVPGIVGFGKAAELRASRLEQDSVKLKNLASSFFERLSEEVGGVKINGHPTRRIPGHLSIVFDGVDGEALLMNLDTMGISASAGAACSSGALKMSSVLKAIGLSADEALGTLRVSFGRDNSEEDVNIAVEAIKEQVARLRKTMPEAVTS